MKINQIKAGAMLSYVSMGLSTIISLVYTPIMLQRLGESEFGVYQAVLPIISYLNLLSFGLGSAYVRYYSRFRAAGDKKGCAKLNGMFLTTYLFLGALVLVIGFGLSYCDVIFGKKLTPDEIALAEKLLRIMTVNAALTFPISVFESHVTINEQYLFQKIVAMGKQVLNPLIMIPLLLIGYRSVTLTIVSLIFTVLSGVINITYCLTRLKMPFAFRHYDFALLREMFGFTLYVFIGIVVDNINWSIDRQLLTWFHGSAAVTVYSIAAQLNNYFLLFGNAISNVMTPRVHRLVAENAPMRTLDALFTKVGRLQFILLGGIFLGFVAIGQSFVVLWGGGEQFRIDYWTALLLFFACLWTNIQTVGIEIQRAKNMHKYRSLVYLGVLVGNIVISIPLCMKWQGLGAAIGTAETPAEPISGLMRPPEVLYITTPPSSPPMVDRPKAQRPSTIIFIVFQLRKFWATIVAPTEVARKMVMIFISAFCAVSLRRSVTPHSRNRLPSIRQPTSGAVDGRRRITKVATTIGKIIFSVLDTSRACSILTLRILSVVHSFMSGGCISGISAMYEYAAMAIGPSRCGASFVHRYIAVGPSAPPRMPMEAASGPVKPSSTAPKNARNTPSCAAAPSSRLLGFASSGPKSVIAPTPRKMSEG